jgi:hypothetical protein
MKQILFLFIVSFQFLLPVKAQQITSVEVVSVGVAQSEEEATTKALVRAISQVNGEAVASKTRLTTNVTQSVNLDSDTGKTTSQSKKTDFYKEIESKTRGVIKSWRIVGKEATKSGDIQIQVAAEVYVLVKSPQSDRMKIALVADPESAGDFTDSVLDTLSMNLVKSRKFAVIDKKNTQVIEDQLSKIRNGEGGIHAQVRLGAEMTPDFLAVVSIGSVAGSKGSQRVSVNLEIIDYATRLIKFSERKSIRVQSDEADSRVVRKANLIASSLYRTVLYTTFPPLVVGADGKFLTIAQGSDYFKIGDKLVIKKLGQSLRDPHTGEFLSYDQTDVGEAVISYVDARISRAQVLKLSISDLNSDTISTQTFQVFRLGQSMDDIFGSTEVKSGNAKKSKKDIFVTVDHDDDD